MVDLVALGLTLCIVLIIFVRKTSAGVAIFSLLAGVMLDQLLGSWVINLLPAVDARAAQYLPVIVHLLIVFVPVLASVIAVRTSRHNAVLSLLTSLTLGFLMVLFGIKIVAPLPEVVHAAKNSGLLHFLDPYVNAIIAGSAVLGVIEMTTSHRRKTEDKKKK
jgi:hypothetical protein